MSAADFNEFDLLEMSHIDNSDINEMLDFAQDCYVEEAQCYFQAPGLIKGIKYFERPTSSDGSPVSPPTGTDGSPIDFQDLYIKDGIIYIPRSSTKGVYSYNPSGGTGTPVDWNDITDAGVLNGYMRVASTTLYIAREHHMVNLYVSYINGYLSFMLNDSWES